MSGLLPKMDHWARGLVPLLCTLCVVLISAVPTRLPFAAMITPSLTLVAVYYWTIYRPDLLNGFFILLLGVLQDLLAGGPPGISSFVFLLVYVAVVSQRKFFHGKNFSVVWWGFMIIAIGACLLAWLANMILMSAWIDPTAPAISLLLTILFYPVLAALLSQAHRLVPARDAEA